MVPTASATLSTKVPSSPTAWVFHSFCGHGAHACSTRAPAIKLRAERLQLHSRHGPLGRRWHCAQLRWGRVLGPIAVGDQFTHIVRDADPEHRRPVDRILQGREVAAQRAAQAPVLVQPTAQYGHAPRDGHRAGRPGSLDPAPAQAARQRAGRGGRPLPGRLTGRLPATGRRASRSHHREAQAHAEAGRRALLEPKWLRRCRFGNLDL